MRKFVACVFAGASTVLFPVAAGASDPAAAFVDARPEPLRPYFKKLWAEGERNAVLNFTQLAVFAMENGQYTIAERALDEALLRIDSIRTDDANAEKARSKFNAENVKDFKGEPYERAMAYYYRGLLFARVGDYENARAAFLNAGTQIAFSKDEKWKGDFGLMNLMASWCSLCAGDPVRAKELRQAALAEDAALASIPELPRSIVLVETGAGPIKAGEGKFKQMLVFQEPPNSEDSIEGIRFTDGAGDRPLQEVKLWKAGDVAYQAMIRGGRPIQGILDGKVQFKEGAGVVGAVAGEVGRQAVMQAISSNSRSMANFGLAGMFIGMVADAAANATKPAADLRAWSNLPREIHVAPFDDVALNGRLAAFVARAGGATHPTRVLATSKGCTLLWGRTRSAALDQAQLALDTFSDAQRASGDDAFRARIADRF